MALGGVFKLELFLTPSYPMDPPKVRFLTRLYHPNVDKLGPPNQPIHSCSVLFDCLLGQFRR